MARIPYLDKSDLSADDQDLLARDLNIYKAIANSPGGARNFGRMGRYIRHESPLDPRLRELAILQVGYLARSPYEYSHHIEIGRDFGVSDDDLAALAEESAGRQSELEPLARWVLKAAREMTTDLAISDQTYAALAQDLDSECLTDLVLTIGFYNGVVRILASLEIDVEDEYLGYLDEFPLPED
jgi:alkylhydroperoxidase family enzyme